MITSRITLTASSVLSQELVSLLRANTKLNAYNGLWHVLIDKCGMENIPRKDMDEHKKICPVVVYCEYHAMGCEYKAGRGSTETHNGKYDSTSITN